MVVVRAGEVPKMVVITTEREAMVTISVHNEFYESRQAKAFRVLPLGFDLRVNKFCCFLVAHFLPMVE